MKSEECRVGDDGKALTQLAACSERIKQQDFVV